ncbi:CHY zinc finger protein [Staphylococcus aureus]|nr:CHY zinc finger protein [Staphylococcus aureus]
MPKVYGSLIDTETRCRHYFTEEDIIAIKFKCCNKYYPCYKCHNEFEKHAIERCPNCQSRFNNRCKYHYHIYFEI